MLPAWVDGSAASDQGNSWNLDLLVETVVLANSAPYRNGVIDSFKLEFWSEIFADKISFRSEHLSLACCRNSPSATWEH